ncbi:hypothetical protein B0T26DRAFT_752697 [Lasiosphaeria miniovina]|uniref:Tyrosinase copper-binding domain-containing protein n=1 Tax=Lasiosphaeria miniovina TaxID=1954250 RepID=A0AA40AAY5_9PEZI|nr:uncharacterized protein B0T26DRAFT_752697 [Lasiosphaeria miniovina]KAK0712464.1 hypothetical protein B0T26DRAFT_752697 [Lasiosphaeria miniovina]
MSSKEATHAIKGLQATQAHPPLRLEIDDWYTTASPDHQLQVTMFVLALMRFQAMSIYGSSYLPWHKINGAQKRMVGYCTHDSILFATWHRVYLLLSDVSVAVMVIAD